ncbi:MAG: hypothetical protein M5U34_08310 [Chloroflexi bacterium]|nr:hypothetical protein [Chloroflexota bacterium]
MANGTQNKRARQFVGVVQPGVILVHRRAASPAASPAPNVPNGRGAIRRGDAAGRHPGSAPRRVTGCLARAQHTQHTQRARRFVGAMQPGVILVQRRAASPAASPAPNMPNGRCSRASSRFTAAPRHRLPRPRPTYPTGETIRRGDAAGRHPGSPPRRVTGCLARAQHTQHTQRARRWGDQARRLTKAIPIASPPTTWFPHSGWQMKRKTYGRDNS